MMISVAAAAAARRMNSANGRIWETRKSMGLGCCLRSAVREGLRQCVRSRNRSSLLCFRRRRRSYHCACTRALLLPHLSLIPPRVLISSAATLLLYHPRRSSCSPCSGDSISHASRSSHRTPLGRTSSRCGSVASIAAADNAPSITSYHRSCGLLPVHSTHLFLHCCVLGHCCFASASA